MVFWGSFAITLANASPVWRRLVTWGIPLRSLLTTLHCRRVAGVSTLLLIGWWYLSSVFPKNQSCRGNATDKEYRVYPLDPHPDAVVLSILGVLQVGAVSDYCQLTGTMPPLLESVVDGGTPGRSYVSRLWIHCYCNRGSANKNYVSFTNQVISSPKSFLNSRVTISPHKTRNSCRSVISEPELMNTPESEILQGFSDQGYTQMPEVRSFSKTSCQKFQLTCSRCESVEPSSTDCTLEPKCVSCTQSHPSD
ncbi:hypothetical protein TNCV_2000111 [Trichonephila clavipes]|nr:hypothetical protein TNCV_2000111 [Trichonephila clavipes]